MKAIRKIISALLVVMMVAGFMPQAAFAAPPQDTGKAIQLGTSGISCPSYEFDYIYLGNWTAPDKYTTTGPIKWRVLDTKTNTGGSGLFLLTEALYGTGYDGGVVFSESNSNVWQGSNAQAWCKEFYDNSISKAEKGAVLSTTKSDGEYSIYVNDDPSTPGGLLREEYFAATDNILNKDKVFFLSVEEVKNYDYNLEYNLSGKYGDNSQSGDWWLRSPVKNQGVQVGKIDFNARDVESGYVSIGYKARPALNLDSSTVLFSSAATGGKSATGMDTGLAAVSDYTGSEWKLTLLDSSRKFAVTETTASGQNGDTVTLNYTGATVGDNDYISAMITDTKGVQYYGRLMKPIATDGQLQMTIPASLAPGNYTLQVFSEQYNGDCKTDYASALDTVTLTVEEPPAPKAIQLGTSGISGYNGGYDYIYLGNWNAPDNYTTTGPIKWRVLDNQTNTGAKGFFLVSEALYGTGKNGSVVFSERNSNVWQGSAAQAWCRDFCGKSFSTAEQGAVLPTTKTDEAYATKGEYSTPYDKATNILDGDKVFLLSAEEAENGAYGFVDNKSRDAYYGEKTSNWWLRSPQANNPQYAGAVMYGEVAAYGVGSQRPARPALNLAPNAVLFSSAATGGKSASGMDTGLAVASDYTGNEWKLTLLDNSRPLKISGVTTNTGGDTIAFSYAGAQTGTNEYLSAAIVEKGAITHYGRIMHLDGTTNGANGQARLALPAGVTLSDKAKLYVFNEQYNGGASDDAKRTDYSSAMIEVQPTVDTTAPTLTAGTATRDSEANATVKFTASEAGSYYHAVVESGATAPSIDTTGAGTPCDATEQTISVTGLTGAGAKDLYIIVKDAMGNESDMLKMTIPEKYIAPPSKPTLPPTVPEAEGGAVEVGPARPSAGDTVTVTPKPQEGMVVDQIIVTDKNGNKIEVTQAPNGDFTFKQPDSKVTITVTFKPAVPSKLPFEDVSKEDYFFAPIAWAVQNNITAGVSATEFAPHQSCTRAQMVTFLWRANGAPMVEADLPFTDVAEGTYYSDAVRWAVSKGIVAGTSATTFSPDATVTRAQTVTFLHRQAGEPLAGDHGFTDVADGMYYSNAVAWAVENNITAGTSDTTFSPLANCTRAQIVTFLYRAK